jgi:TolA-binding protein
MRTLTNRVEILEAELASQKEANLRLARLIDENRALAATANQAQAPTNGASEPTPAPTATDANPASSDTQAGSAPATLPASNEPTTPLPSAGGAVAAPAVTEPPKPSPVLLAEARMHIQRGEFQIAEAKLNEIAENHGDSPEAPEALWLLGETRFVQQAFAPAAQAYVAYLGKSPNGPRMPNAYVGLASAFRELGDNRQRCLALAEYTRRATNPTSVQRARADAEIARAPCP